MSVAAAVEVPWKPHRRIGGSDIPKLLGISPYGNAADVYERIVLGREDEWKPIMERGAAMEPVLRAYGQRALGLELEDTVTDYHDSAVYEFARAQVDDLARWEGLPIAVDYKSQNRWVKGWGPPGSDQVPEHLRAQLTWELICTDRQLGLLLVGFGEDRPAPELFCLANVIPYWVERDELFERYCLQVAREFWETAVLPRTPPPMKPLGKNKRSKQ